MSEFGEAGERATDARLRQHGEALRAERGGCPHPELLFARQSEALDAELRSRLEAHVATCAACRRLADDVDSLDLSEPDDAVERRVRARVAGTTGAGTSGLWSLAAGLLLASGLGVTWWYSRSDSPATSSPVATHTPAVTAPTRTATPVVALWAIAPAPVRLPLSSLGVPRSGAGSNPDGAVLIAALAPYQLGDYVNAVSRLSAIVRDFPDSGEAHFYLGVSQLMAGHAEQAVGSLDRAVVHLPAAQHAEAEWYRATAEQRAGLTDRAQAHLQALCEKQGEYQAQACAAEASLK